MSIWGLPRKTNVFGSHNKDYGILGSILGSPYLWKLPPMMYAGASEHMHAPRQIDLHAHMRDVLKLPL